MEGTPNELQHGFSDSPSGQVEQVICTESYQSHIITAEGGVGGWKNSQTINFRLQ
jgi:hypothetical protein